MDINERELIFNQKYLHQKKTVEYLSWVNTSLVYIYYLCALVITYYLITKYDFTLYSNILFILLLGIYPFVAYYLQEKIYNSFDSISSLFSISGLFLYNILVDWLSKLFSLPIYYFYMLIIIYAISVKDGFTMYTQLPFFIFLILYPYIGEYIHTNIF
jgi:hypothetical protein